MLFDVMKPVFIWEVLIFGLAACVFVVLAVYTFYRDGRTSPYVFRPLAFAGAAFGFVTLFVSVTAFAQQQKSILYIVAAVFFIFFATFVSVFCMMIFKKNLSFPKGIVDYGKIIDATGAPFVIYDGAGNAVSSSLPEDQRIHFNRLDNVIFALGISFDELYAGAIKEYEGRNYSVHLSDIKQGRRTVGRVLLFNDITEIHRLKEKVEHYNNELRRLNAILEEEASVEEDIVYQKERTRIADEIGKRIGMGVQSITEAAITASGETDLEKQADNMTKIAADIRALLADIRQTVRRGGERKE